MYLLLVKHIKELEKHHKEIWLLLNKSVPGSIVNLVSIKNISKDYSVINNIVNMFRVWVNTNKESIWLEKLLADNDIWSLAKEESILLNTSKTELEQKLLKSKAVPKDEYDNYGCLIEIKAGAGGNEASLFVNDLYRMYYKYAENKRWNISLLSKSSNNYGGSTETIFKVTTTGTYGLLRFESGGHRVQRIPNTETQGRIHTSTCIVAVLVESREVNIAINPSELRIDTFRSSGAGGQHVNKTDSAVRITHLPTNIVSQNQNSRSQHRNKDYALKQLKSKLYQLALSKKNLEKKTIEESKLSISWGNQIRSYILDNSLVKDLRTGLESRDVQSVLDGNLDMFIIENLKLGL